MDQLFKIQNDKGWKTLLASDYILMFVNRSYDSAEEFLEKFNEKGLLKERMEISILDIRKMVHPENNGQGITVVYPGREKDIWLNLGFTNESEREQFIRIVSKPRKMTAQLTQVNIFKAIASLLTGLGIIAMFTFLTYGNAIMIKRGGQLNADGTRSMPRGLFAWLGKTLGSDGALVAGTALGMLCLYLIYKRLQSRPNEIVYS